MRLHLQFPRFVLLFIPVFLLSIHAYSRNYLARSYYNVVKNAEDILIIRVDSVDGEAYGQKAIAHIERSLKGKIDTDRIDLPFVYKSWPFGNGNMRMSPDIVPVSFEVGKRYVVLLQKAMWSENPNHAKLRNPKEAKTEFEVLQYPKRPFFEIADTTDFRLWEIKQFLGITKERDTVKQAKAILRFLPNDSSFVRIDAIEALMDLRYKGPVDPLISTLKNDSDSAVRGEAAFGLGFFRDEKGIDPLLEQLRIEKNEEVVSRIIDALGMCRAKKAIPLFLSMYETGTNGMRNNILSNLMLMPDSSELPSLIKYYASDVLNRYPLIKIIASIPTSTAHEFSAVVLDTADNLLLKMAVIEGWMASDFKKGYGQIAKWNFTPCEGRYWPFVLQLLYAIEKLGTPDQIVPTLKRYEKCSDKTVRNQVLSILKNQRKKNLSPELLEEVNRLIAIFSN